MTEDLQVRRARPADAAEILEIYGPLVELTAVSFEERVPDPSEMAGRIKDSLDWLVCEQTSEIVGYAYAGAFHPRPAYRWSAEVSVYVRESHRGAGVGRLLLRNLLEQLTELGIVNAYAGIALPNDASIRLFKSFGFERVAHYPKVGFKLGKWYDVAWWGLRLSEGDVPPAEIGRLQP
jgi:L-amino acid N-acyltransferase YncA